jgi:hypothetical protein
MSENHGRLECVNVVELSFSDGGRSLRLDLRSSIPPYESTALKLQNAFSIRLSQSPGDEYPYFVPEVRWRPIPQNERADVLREMNYDFFDEQNKPLIADRELVVFEMEGALCGRIVAEKIICE